MEKKVQKSRGIIKKEKKKIEKKLLFPPEKTKDKLQQIKIKFMGNHYIHWQKKKIMNDKRFFLFF